MFRFLLTGLPKKMFPRKLQKEAGKAPSNMYADVSPKVKTTVDTRLLDTSDTFLQAGKGQH